MIKKMFAIAVLCLFLFPAVAGAFDYKAWMPSLPKTLGGMTPTGEPDGMNMDMGGQKWSTLNQEYTSRDGKRTAQLSIVAGQMAPQVQGFHGRDEHEYGNRRYHYEDSKCFWKKVHAQPGQEGKDRNLDDPSKKSHADRTDT